MEEHEPALGKALLSIGGENIALNVGKIEFDGHVEPLDTDDARRLRGPEEVIGLICGDKVPEGGAELLRRRRVHRQQLAIDSEAGGCPLQMEGLENSRKIRCRWKRVRATR